MNTNATAVQNALNSNLTVPAFNIPYPPMMEPVIRAVRDEDAFAFIAVARIEWEKLGAIGPAVIAGEFREYEDPRHVSLHLDHVPVIDEDDLQVDWEPIFRPRRQYRSHPPRRRDCPRSRPPMRGEAGRGHGPRGRPAAAV